METLREYKPSLLRPAPEDEAVSRSHGNGTDPGKHDTLPSAAEPVATTHEPSPHPAPLPDHYAHDYCDPLIPRRAVPYAALKRIFDLIIAFMVLMIASPIMLVVAILIKLTSRGPIIFRQTRVGQGGRYFWCYKFRSMCADAEAQKKHLMHLNEASGPVFKIKSDPRITPIGSFIRRTSLDELPQLFNVIKGEMSIVGPRPPIPSEVALYGPRERGRLAVPPGLTCLWQIGGRSNISFDRWVELDLLYIDTMSFTNDLKIVLKTIPAVLLGSGAH